MYSNTKCVLHSFPVWLPQTQTWMYNQVKYLPGNIEVHIACDRTEHLEQFDLPNIHSLQDESRLKYFREMGFRKLKLRWFLRHLAEVAEKNGAELIHSHFGHIGWADLPTARRIGVRHIVTFYGADVNKLPRQDVRWFDRYHELFRSADLILCEGPHMAQELVRLGCQKEKIRIHHLGVDIRKFQYQPRLWEGDTPLRVLIVAGFKEKKGIPFALHALGRLQSLVPLTVTIIGDAYPQPEGIREKRQILQTLADTGLSNRTRLLGFQSNSDVLREAYDHNVFLSPSVTASNGDTEGGAPVTLIEMMATGIPVVSTRHCDIPEVVKYGDDDWLVAERDVDGLVDRLMWLVENRQHWGDRLAMGRSHIVEEFDAVQQGVKLGKLYRSLLNSSHES
jgi:colanic acid/amylovoran biosynthesis glycosyltransferase